MGIEVYLIPEDNSELFELGKTRSGLDEADAFSKTCASLPDKETLTKSMISAAEECGSWDKSVDLNKHLGQAADKILAWANGRKVRLVYDHDLERAGLESLKVSGSRYEK